MQKYYTLILFILLTTGACVAQDSLPPKYLVIQDFPDSVKNLNMLTLDGKKINLAQVLALHKGKKVIIDFWASWCKDCIVGLPKVKELQQQINPDKIAYVFISVDKEDVKWQSAINRFGMQGDHYRIEAGWYSTLTNYIDLDWIPRYLVLNGAGRIIIPKAITVDNEDLRKSVLE